MLIECAQSDVPKDIGSEPLLSVLLLESLVPVCGSELEDAVVRPGGQQAQQIAQVAVRLDAVELTAREKRDGSGVNLAAFVSSDEEPVFSTMRCSA